KGDVVVGLGDLENPSATQLVEYIQARPEQMLPMVVLRNDAPVTVHIMPQSQAGADGQQVGRIGVMLGADFPMVTVRYGLFESVWRGVGRTADTAWFSLKSMARMVIGEVSVRNISGPV